MSKIIQASSINSNIYTQEAYDQTQPILVIYSQGFDCGSKRELYEWRTNNSLISNRSLTTLSLRSTS